MKTRLSLFSVCLNLLFQYREKPPSKDIFSRRVKTICQRGDIEPIRLHDLRHSHVALLIHQGEDYAMIKKRLGHASIKTDIDVYGHLFSNKQRETADRLDDLFKKSATRWNTAGTWTLIQRLFYHQTKKHQHARSVGVSVFMLVRSSGLEPPRDLTPTRPSNLWSQF
ncbi:hypothetical protein EPH95_16020 [Salicibibacter halophilus]|uniref:Tyr recombinase domain-containing protein n=1 Tax=Salicibibacter halophilus TaxID=2502791 RepID=A0A514LMX4_9BACI|nr:hypothetical protein EPH95_16020 [Salicibibacter halophilus]